MKFTILTCIVLYLLQVGVYAMDMVLMKVYLNQEDKGDRFFLLDENIPLLQPQELKDMNLQFSSDLNVTHINGKDYLSLDELSPEVTFYIDERGPSLFINANADHLAKNVFSLPSSGVPKNLKFEDSISTYINYRVNYNYSDSSQQGTLNIPLSMNYYNGGYSVFSDFNYIKNEDKTQFVRLFSSITHDNRESLTRFTLGDFTASSGSDGGGGVFGGISFSKNYSINPYLLHSYGLSAGGVAKTPSQVEYYVGDRLVFSQNVSPGEFEFHDLRPPSGAHDSRMVIKDAFGNEYVIDDQIYYASGLLRPGISEFSYYAGFERKNFGVKNFSYGKPALLGHHRVGLNEWLTVGGRGELNSDVVNIGGNANFLMSNVGEIGTNISVSHSKSLYGYAASLNYRYASQNIGASLNLRRISRDYSNINIHPEDDKLRYSLRTGLNFNSPKWGSLSVSYTTQEHYSGDKTNLSSLYYSKKISSSISLTSVYTQTRGSIENNEFSVNISIPFGSGKSGSVSHSMSGDKKRLSGHFSKNRSLARGFGYKVNAGLQDDNKDVNLLLDYAGPVGVYSGGYKNRNNQGSYSIGMTGAVSWIDGGVHLSKAVTNSFALVKVGELPNVNVTLNNQFIGNTNENGELIIPTLISYYGNKISLDEKSIPINYDLLELKHLTATPFRGGGVVNFDIRRLQAFYGQLYVLDGENKIPAEYWGLSYTIQDKKIETVIGKEGEFYLENLLPGKIPIKIYFGKKECNFNMEIPEHDEFLINLGEITCEINN